MKHSGVVNKHGCHTALSDDVEREIYNHIKYMESALYGLTSLDVRRLAFEVAEKTTVKSI